MQKKISSMSENFNDWYQDVIEAAELADHGPVRGTMVIRPYAYSMWELIQRALDEQIKAKGVQNAYFPLFIPESFLKKEAQHIEGFAPELAVVTHAGGKKLEEPVVVRPTSETIIYSMFSKWITSWRDLPFKINQWANVVRWEMRTRFFLRTTEFLWQEGHTAHATLEEADAFARSIQEMYRSFIETYLAIPVLLGEKPESERFAGAQHTYTFEAMMRDGKALQMGTSHVLLQSFSQAFNVAYQDRDGQVRSPYCTSWGVTTRLIGALIMVHGDDRGLVIPPKIAPIQVVIIAIFKSDDDKERVLKKIHELKESLKQQEIRVHIGDDERKTFGARLYHWEVRGVPLRVEVGPRDLDLGTASVVSRLETGTNKKKESVPFDQLPTMLSTKLKSIQTNLFERAKLFREQNFFIKDLFSEFKEQLAEKNGFFQVGWCGNRACENVFKEHKATIRCIIMTSNPHSHCCVCKEQSKHEVVVAKSY